MPTSDYRRVIDDDRAALAATLAATSGDRKRTAAALGVSRDTVHRWLRRWPDVARQFPPLTRGRPIGVKERKPRQPRAPACVRALGLAWPCARAEVVAAWRRAAFAAHPDGGGSDRAFVRARDAYEAALRLVAAREKRPAG